VSLIHVFRELELRLGDVEPAFPFLPDRLWCLIMIISCGRCEVGKLSRALYLIKDNIHVSTARRGFWIDLSKVNNEILLSKGALAGF